MIRMKPTFYLHKSKNKEKKFTLVMPSYNHQHHFGGVKANGEPYRDYTLINDTKSKFYISDKARREKVKASYIARHSKDKGLDNIHSPAEMSMVILWSAPTLDGGIRNFERKHGVNIIKKF